MTQGIRTEFNRHAGSCGLWVRSFPKSGGMRRALLVVDATQGVQAQTLANLHQAREHNLVVIPLINKIDMPNARIEETEKELEGLGFRKEDIMKISAKTGRNVDSVFDAIITRIPAPHGDPQLGSGRSFSLRGMIHIKALWCL